MLEDWLKSRGNAPEDYRLLCERTVSWDDPRYVTRLTEEQVARLLTLKRTGEVLDVVAQRVNLDQSFRPTADRYLEYCATGRARRQRIKAGANSALRLRRPLRGRPARDHRTCAQGSLGTPYALTERARCISRCPPCSSSKVQFRHDLLRRLAR